MGTRQGERNRADALGALDGHERRSPSGTMRSGEEIRERVRQALAKGTLPPNDGTASSRPGIGRTCTVCGKQINAPEIEFELVSPQHAFADRACYDIWRQESLEREKRGARPRVMTAETARPGERLELLAVGADRMRLMIAGRAYTCAVITTQRHVGRDHELPTGSVFSVAQRSADGDILAEGPCGCHFLLYNFTALGEDR